MLELPVFEVNLQTYRMLRQPFALWARLWPQGQLPSESDKILHRKRFGEVIVLQQVLLLTTNRFLKALLVKAHAYLCKTNLKSILLARGQSI